MIFVPVTYLFRAPPLLLILLTTLLLHPGHALAWGAKGHRIVAALAEQRLTPATQNALAELLQGEDLGAVATWADDMRSSEANAEFWRDWAANWHYVNIPAGQRYEEAPKNPRGDAYQALFTFSSILLKDPIPEGPVRTGLESYFGELQTDSVELQRFALKFLIHIVADLHQPLHNGYLEDRGGNSIDLLWNGETTNLHRLWDSQLLDSRNTNEAGWVRRLGNRISRIPVSDLRGLEQLDMDVWTSEADQLLSRIHDSQSASRNPDDTYTARFLPTVEYQLIRASLRTARFLNSIYGGWDIGSR